MRALCSRSNAAPAGLPHIQAEPVTSLQVASAHGVQRVLGREIHLTKYILPNGRLFSQFSKFHHTPPTSSDTHDHAGASLLSGSEEPWPKAQLAYEKVNNGTVTGIYNMENRPGQGQKDCGQQCQCPTPVIRSKPKRLSATH